jgi:hypothetical protein
LNERQKWLASGSITIGSIEIDDGAYKGAPANERAYCWLVLLKLKEHSAPAKWCS